MKNKINKEAIETVKTMIKNGGYWDQAIPNYLKDFMLNAANKILNQACIELQDEYYKQTGLYKSAQEIYNKLQKATQEEIKKLEQWAANEYIKIDKPLNDYSFFDNIKR
jgi:hypothetical protein